MRNIFIFLILSFLGHLTSNAQFKEGFIIDKHGERFPGFINFVEGESLYYKATKGGDREQFTIHNLNAFVIEEDSFITIKDFKVTAKKKVSGFAEVLITRPDKLLCTISSHTTTQSTAMVNKWESTHYVIQSGPKLYLLTKSNFLKEMPALVDDDSALKQKILSKELRFDDMDKIISQYKRNKKKSRD